MTRNVLLIVVGIILFTAGYLGYDYYMWHKYLEPDPSVLLYGWTDAQGVRHYTDSAPPAGADDIRITQGFKHRRLPLVMKAKEKIIGVFRKDGPKPSKKPVPPK